MPDRTRDNPEQVERRTFPVSEARVKRDEDGNPKEIVTDVAVYDSQSEDLGGFVERIEPGALEFDDDVTSEFNHNPDKVLGRRSAGTLEIEETDESVRFVVDPPDTTYARDLAESIDRGDVQGGSFTFAVPEGGDEFQPRQGEPDLRIIHRATVFEGGPVTHPAYRDTHTELRDTKVAEQRHREWRSEQDEPETRDEDTKQWIPPLTVEAAREVIDAHGPEAVRDVFGEALRQAAPEDRQSRPEFEDTEDRVPDWVDEGNWDRPNLSDHPEASEDDEWGDLPDEERTAIANRFIEGGASVDTYADLGNPVVNPATDNLNRNGVLAARQRPASDAAEAIADALWEDHFEDEEENTLDVGTAERLTKLEEAKGV